MGHPEPFKMTYLEIGNENWGPDYEKRYNMIYKKVKELYPQIKTIANEHVEKNGCPAECVDEHFYNTTEFFAERVNYYDDYDRKGTKIFAGEVDPVSITLDCQVQVDYTVTLLSGEKGDENSFEEPEKVKNITVNMHGASSEFVYEAPPYSVSALRLKKCEAF